MHVGLNYLRLGAFVIRLLRQTSMFPKFSKVCIHAIEFFVFVWSLSNFADIRQTTAQQNHTKRILKIG